MKNLINLLTELKDRPLTISTTTKGEQVQQTQRNALKAEILQAIYDDIKASYDYVYRSADGLLLEIANDSIADNLKSELGSGAVTVSLDIKVKGLDFNAEVESESYDLKQAEKAEKAKRNAETKAKKIASDQASRKAKKGE